MTHNTRSGRLPVGPRRGPGPGAVRQGGSALAALALAAVGPQTYTLPPAGSDDLVTTASGPVTAA
jgi:hypothetical protein